MPSSTSSSSPRPAALVCDDDAIVRRIVSAVLERSGFHRVEQTHLAADAVEVAETLQPEVIVLDLTLDGESGLDAIPELRAVAPRSRIVVYSASAVDAPARRAGADAVLSKLGRATLSDLERVVSE